MLVYVVWYMVKSKDKLFAPQSNNTKNVYRLLIFWVILVFVDGLRAGNLESWFSEVALKLPLVVVPLYVLTLDKSSCQFRNSWLMFAMLTMAVAAVSTINYGLNYEEINTLLLQSKHVPIFGNMHHIYFGIVMSLCIWICLFFYKTDSRKNTWLALGIMLALMLHILASRTGLVAFYASAVVYGMAQVWQSKKYKLIAFGLIGMMLTPILAYQISGSFRNKVLNSVEDFNAVTSGEDINYKSLAMRVEAWKTSMHVIEKNLILGVGASNVDKEIQHQYMLDDTILYPENRVGPHNQFLELSLAYGLVGGVLLLLIAVLLIFLTRNNPATIAITAIFIISFMLESVLERQQGILVFCLVIFSFTPLSSKSEKETQH